MIILYCVSTNEEFNKLLEKYNNEIKIGNELLIENVQLIKQINNLKNENDKLLIDKNNYYNEWQNSKNKMEKDMKIYEMLINDKQEFDRIILWMYKIITIYQYHNDWGNYCSGISAFHKNYNNLLKEVLLLIKLLSIPYIEEKNHIEYYNKERENLKNAFYNYLGQTIKEMSNNIIFYSLNCSCLLSFKNGKNTNECEYFRAPHCCPNIQLTNLQKIYYNLSIFTLLHITKNYHKQEEELQRIAKIINHNNLSEDVLISNLEKLKSQDKKNNNLNILS